MRQLKTHAKRQKGGGESWRVSSPIVPAAGLLRGAYRRATSPCLCVGAPCGTSRCLRFSLRRLAAWCDETPHNAFAQPCVSLHCRCRANLRRPQLRRCQAPHGLATPRQALPSHWFDVHRIAVAAHCPALHTLRGSDHCHAVAVLCNAIAMRLVAKLRPCYAGPCIAVPSLCISVPLPLLCLSTHCPGDASPRAATPSRCRTPLCRAFAQLL